MKAYSAHSTYSIHKLLSIKMIIKPDQGYELIFDASIKYMHVSCTYNIHKESEKLIIAMENTFILKSDKYTYL